MFLPGPPFRTRALDKIRNIARQIERINLDFLESKVLDRALTINVFSGPDPQKAPSTTGQPQEGPDPVGEEMAANHEASHPFASYTGQMVPNLGMFYTFRVETIDHLGLVRGTWPEQVEKEGADWVRSLGSMFHSCGYSEFTTFTLAYKCLKGTPRC